MKLSSKSQDVLIKEISYCRKKIAEEPNPIRKTFYYGGMIGKIFSIRNFEFDPELNFINFVLGTSYNTLRNYFEEEQPFELPKIFFDKLCEYLEQLETKIKNKENTYNVLEKIINLSMIADVYGYYLFEKGELKIED
jgi:hypothetical protein